MDIEHRLRAAHAFDPGRFMPCRCDGLQLGWVKREFLGCLAAFPDVFRIGTGCIEVRGAPDDYAGRTEAMDRVAGALAQSGLLTRWRDERYQIGLADHGRALFALERAAVRFFGFTARAVHLNGLAVRGGEPCMWIARRSPVKAIDPGMLDNLMGGGIGGALGIEETLVKEAWEEAGIPPSLAALARKSGVFRVCREVPDGLHAEVIHVYDLDLPEDFAPVNQDGEVAEFRCVRLQEVAAELAGDASYTVDAALVAIDCLRRRGVLPGPPLSSPG